MNPIESLKNDHRTVERLFAEVEEMDGGGFRQRRPIIKKIVEELTIHSRIEERVIYPFLRDRVPEMEEKTLEALEEHAIVDRTVSELRRARGGDDDRLRAKLHVLQENVKKHIEEEENELLPKLEESCSEEELIELGEQLDEARLAGARGGRRASTSSSRSSSRSRSRGQKKSSRPARRRRAA